MPQRGQRLGGWDSGALGKLQGEGKDFLKLGRGREWSQAGRGPPSPPSLPRRLPPPLFTYEVAHGGRIGIPVTLPKRHSSPHRAGPRKSASTALGLPTPPARCPWLLLFGRALPGICRGCATCPTAAGRRGTRRGARGRGHGDARAPATCPAGAARRRRSGPPRGVGGRQLPRGVSAGETAGLAPGRGTRVRLWSPRNRPQLGGGGCHSLGMRHPCSDTAVYWSSSCSSLRLLFPFVEKEMRGY